MNRRLVLVPLLGSIAALLPARAAEIQKANNASALNTAGSWQAGALPTAIDVALWDALVTAPNTSAIGGDLAWQGIKITNVGGARNTTNNVVISSANSANTLTLGSAGIDMSAATQELVIQSKLLLSANQTWNISNANTATGAGGLNVGEDLTLFAQAAAAPFDLGGFTLTKTGAGVMALSSGYTVSNGSFVVNEGVMHFQGGSSRVTNINFDASFTINNGGTVAFASQSGGININAPITLNTGGSLNIIPGQGQPVTLNGNITVAGNSNLNVLPQLNNAQNAAAVLTLNGSLIGSGNLTYNNTLSTVTNQLRMAGDNSGYTGTLTMGATAGARILRLQSATSGSAAATWAITTGNILQVDGVAVDLGTLTGAGTITNSHASTAATINVKAGDFSGSITDGTVPMSLTKIGTGTLVLSGFNTYSGATTVTAGTLLATPGSWGSSNVTVAAGASFGPKLTVAGSPLTVPAITLGTGGGASLLFDLGTLGNPTSVAMSVGTLTVQTASTLKLTGTNLTVGTFPLLGYTSPISGLGFSGLSLVLPPRVLGSMANDTGNSRVNVTITGFDAPKWTGAVNGNWDIDNGTGTGTANWKEINSGSITRYIQSANGADSVRFDDSATGTTTVQLTTDLLPISVTVDNTARDYTFTGSGRIRGGASLTKSGTGTLRIRNSADNDYSGGTTINAGTVELGDGVTAGAGSLGTGPINNSGTLVFNRPDSFTVAPTLSGTGGITKNGAGSVTFTSAVNQSGPAVLNTGSVIFAGGGSLSGPVSGAGALTAAGATFELNGNDANTFTGVATVNNGTLRLNKTPGVNAVGGNVTITGPGVLTIAANEQIPDTATITFTGTSADSTGGTTGTETVANVIVNPSVATGQFIMRNGFTITGTGTLQNGILGVASGNTATVNAVNMSGGTLRIAGSAGPSTLNIGAGGITASGGVIEVKFNINDQDAILNLGGDFTATGNVAINNANYQGLNLNQVVLTGTRTFNIASGTTTTVQPEVAGTGGLTKTGGGTLDLLGRFVSYTGNTVVSGGTLRTSTAAQTTAAAVTVGDTATLALRVTSPGTTLTAQSLAIGGGTTGGTISFDLSGLGNPTIAPLTTTAFTVSGSNNKLVLLGNTTPGTFPLIDYTGNIGGAGFSGLSLVLPLRVAGNLVNNTANTSVDLMILGTDTPKWNGNISTAWDIDNGTGTGTANWKGSASGNALRYLQGAAGTDQVIFDDTATGSGTVNLTTTLTPVNATVTNSAKTYTFVGTGKLSGAAVLTKEGTGTLVLANTTAYDHTGGTFINAGTLQVGDGTTAGAGILPNGTVTNTATLALNRPDDFDIATTIAGTGTIAKNRANTASFILPTTYAGPIALNAGTLRFAAGGNLSGVISGTADLLVDGGTLQLSGFEANTMTGMTTVASGTLQLNKSGVNAIGGNLTLLGSAALTLSQAEQIADTATLIFNKTSGNQVIGNETLAAVNIIGSSETAQLQANNGFLVTGKLTMSTGVFAVASNHSGTVGGLDISGGGTVRIAANSNPSTLNVGALGITASSGLIQVGQGTGAFDAALNLNGNVTTTGDLNITDGGFGGTQKREINLGTDTRTFNIADATTTTIAPDIAGTGGLTKTGNGTLNLTTASVSTYTGNTAINAGTVIVNGSINGSTVAVNNGGTLLVQGSLAGPGLSVNAGGTLGGTGTITAPATISGKNSPGISAPGLETFTNNLTYAAGGGMTWELISNADFGEGFNFDRVNAQGLNLTLQGGTTLNLVFNLLGSIVDFKDPFWNSEHQWTIIDYSGTGASTGTFGTPTFTTDSLGATLASAHPTSSFTTANIAGDIVLKYSLIPEPSSATLIFGAGVVLLGMRRRRSVRS